MIRTSRSLTSLLTAATIAAGSAMLAPAAAAADQYLPLLVYRTGPYAPNGVPTANGMHDYLKLINERDGGINGVKLLVDECETGYATARGVECYERVKSQNGGAGIIHPWSTGITFALTDKAPSDKIPLITAGYGLSASADGEAFKWNFILGGSYWIAADVLIQRVADQMGGLDKLKGKKIALVYHDSPFGKEPIPLLEERAKLNGFTLMTLPVTHPGVEQKSTWLQVRRERPDALLLWGWGVMNSTAIKEAVATGYPREKMYGVWWSGAEPDVVPAGDGAKGYNAVVFLGAGAGKGKLHADIAKFLYDKGKGSGSKDEVGEVLYNRGLLASIMSVEGIRTAQAKYGKKVLTGEQIRWGLENLNIDEARIKALGMEGMMLPLSTSCKDHMGNTKASLQTWDGKKWVMDKKVYEADMQIIKPLTQKAAQAYLKEKNLEPRSCAKELAGG